MQAALYLCLLCHKNPFTVPLVSLLNIIIPYISRLQAKIFVTRDGIITE